jgi:hypothetical protein
MAYGVEVTDEWLAWFEELEADEQEELAASIGLLEAGPHTAVPIQQWGDHVEALSHAGATNSGARKAFSNAVRVRSSESGDPVDRRRQDRR